MTIFIGCDPGLGGAIVVMDGDNVSIHDVPKYKTQKGKQDYKLPEMAAILRPYLDKDVVFCIENVHFMSGQGGVSAFNFGRGKGLWEGIAAACGFKIVLVTPQTWKKAYDDLIIKRKTKDSEQELSKKELKSLSSEERKALKEKEKEQKKLDEKEKRKAKAESKAKARDIAGNLYPQFKDKFTKVNSDGRAEALLIANYIKNTYRREDGTGSN